MPLKNGYAFLRLAVDGIDLTVHGADVGADGFDIVEGFALQRQNMHLGERTRRAGVASTFERTPATALL